MLTLHPSSGHEKLNELEKSVEVVNIGGDVE
jgi:hypothetical protein